MESFSQSFDVIWADMDPNRHMRHTAYNDYAAQLRVSFMTAHGLDIDEMEKLQMGPVLFREETRFLSEVRIGERINVDIRIAGLSSDGERWRLVHRIFKRDGSLSAVVTADGAWIDLRKRKLKALPPKYAQDFNKLPRTEDFQEIIKGQGKIS